MTLPASLVACVTTSLLAVSFAIGCASPGAISSPAAPALAPPPAHVALDADDEVRAVIMRDLIDTFGSMEWSPPRGGDHQRVNALCIGFGEHTDPSDAFLERFADEPRVIRASRCVYDDDGGVVRAEPSGLPAMFLYVENVRRLGERAEAKGSFYHDGKGAREDAFVLERRGDRWVVKSRTTISIS